MCPKHYYFNIKYFKILYMSSFTSLFLYKSSKSAPYCTFIKNILIWSSCMGLVSTVLNQIPKPKP